MQSDPRLEIFNKMRQSCYRDNNITHSSIDDEKYNESDRWCPRIFDGFSCWDETPAGTKAYQTCPEFVLGFDPKRFAFKTCTENGSWFVPPNSKKSWTNYTTCVDVDDLNFRNIVNNIYVVGYTISTIAVLLSAFILLYFRVLRCTRVRIHVHLFIALAVSNICWVIWYLMVVRNVSVVQENAVWCQMLHVFTSYYMVTSYLWMFNEGLHLHLALVVVFVKDELAMQWFVAIGWGLSMVITLIYATVRYFTPGATERCWMDQSDTFWIIIAPVGLSLLMSLVFLANVVRVLMMKLHPGRTQQSSAVAWKAARAALILVPLFGLHFILLPFRPLPDSPLEKPYQIVSALLTSLQGLGVAILYCFTNHDVVLAIKAYVSRLRANNEGLPMTAMTGVTGAEL